MFYGYPSLVRFTHVTSLALINIRCYIILDIRGLRKFVHLNISLDTPFTPRNFGRLEEYEGCAYFLLFPILCTMK